MKFKVGDVVAVKPMAHMVISDALYTAIKGIWIGKISNCEVKNGKITYVVSFDKCEMEVKLDEEYIAGLFESFNIDELINSFVTRGEEKERLQDRRDYFMYIIGYMEGTKQVVPLTYPEAYWHAKAYTFGDWRTILSYVHEKKLEPKKKG